MVDAHAVAPHRPEHRREALGAFEFLGQAGRRRQRVQRVAGDDRVEYEPQQRRARRQREIGEPSAARSAHRVRRPGSAAPASSTTASTRRSAPRRRGAADRPPPAAGTPAGRAGAVRAPARAPTGSGPGRRRRGSPGRPGSRRRSGSAAAAPRRPPPAGRRRAARRGRSRPPRPRRRRSSRAPSGARRPGRRSSTASRRRSPAGARWGPGRPGSPAGARAAGRGPTAARRRSRRSGRWGTPGSRPGRPRTSAAKAILAGDESSPARSAAGLVGPGRTRVGVALSIWPHPRPRAAAR